MTSSYYAVKRFIKQSNRFETVALYDSNNNFRGEAVFSTKAEAQKYLELYRDRMGSRLNYYYRKPNVMQHRLKVFKVK